MLTLSLLILSIMTLNIMTLNVECCAKCHVYIVFVMLNVVMPRLGLPHNCKFFARSFLTNGSNTLAFYSKNDKLECLMTSKDSSILFPGIHST
jgi:hypothetical protein